MTAATASTAGQAADADQRVATLRRAAGAVAPGGVLLVVGHAGWPAWVGDDHPDIRLPSTTEVLADLELDLQRLSDGRRARDPDELTDVLRALGPLTRDEVDARCDGPGVEWLEELVLATRVLKGSVAGEERYAAAEDASRVRDALGVALPPGLPPSPAPATRGAGPCPPGAAPPARGTAVPPPRRSGP